MFAVPTRLNRWKQRPRAWTPPLGRTLHEASSDVDISKAGNGAVNRNRTNSLNNSVPEERFKIEDAL